MKRRKRDLSAEEERLWREVARSVAPLRSRARSEKDETTTGAAPSEDEDKTDRGHPGGATPAKVPAIPASAGKRSKPLTELESGYLANMDGRMAGRFKRGRLEIDGRIDLHGMTQAAAHMALRAFVQRGHAMGWRCLLVITGKGQRAEGGIGVIRRAVPLWLNGSDLRPLILGFSQAQPQHGGAGALYVMLKRRERVQP